MDFPYFLPIGSIFCYFADIFTIFTYFRVNPVGSVTLFRKTARILRILFFNYLYVSNRAYSFIGPSGFTVRRTGSITTITAHFSKPLNVHSQNKY